MGGFNIHVAHIPGFIDQPPSPLNGLPPIEWAISILHVMDELTLEDIADRLTIDVCAVAEFMTEARTMLDPVRCGCRFERRSSPVLRHAEASLRGRFRAYCEAELRARGFRVGIDWRADEDEDLSVARAIFEALRPVDLETFLLCQVGGLNCAQIARRMRTFAWIVRRRMVHAIATIDRGPDSFDQWLICIGREGAHAFETGQAIRMSI